VAGRDAELDAFGELGDREPSVLLQFSKNLPVNGIHGQEFAIRDPITGKGWKHFSSLRA
jgi:hypothetical protein